jgi:predicted dehydrogenase
MTSIALIGCGSIAKFHVNGLAAAKATVPLVVDPNPTAAAAAAGVLGAATAGDWRAAISDSRIDTLWVCTPTGFHREIVTAALNAGKHVVCEKTLTNSAADSLALARLAEKQGRLLFTSYMKRFFPAVERAKALMPGLGQVTSVHLRTHQPVGCDMITGAVPACFTPNADGTPSAVHRMAGGGILTCGGSHILDLLIHLVGKPTSVFGRAWTRPGHDVEFMYHGLMDLPNGAVGHIDGTWHPLDGVGVTGTGWDERIEINATGGRLEILTPVWDRPTDQPCRLRHFDLATRSWREESFAAACPFARADAFFLGQLAAGDQGKVDRYTGYRVDAVIEALYASARAGKPVALDWQDGACGAGKAG